MSGHADLSCLPADLAALYAEPETLPKGHIPTQVGISDQLELEVDSAEHAFRRWLEAQPLPEWLVSP